MTFNFQVTNLRRRFCGNLLERSWLGNEAYRPFYIWQFTGAVPFRSCSPRTVLASQRPACRALVRPRNWPRGTVVWQFGARKGRLKESRNLHQGDCTSETDKLWSYSFDLTSVLKVKELTFIDTTCIAFKTSFSYALWLWQSAVANRWQLVVASWGHCHVEEFGCELRHWLMSAKEMGMSQGKVR